MFHLTKVSLRVGKYHLKKLLTLSLVSEKNEKFWQTIFHWLYHWKIVLHLPEKLET